MLVIAAIIGVLIAVGTMAFLLILLGWILFQLLRIPLYLTTRLDWSWPKKKHREEGNTTNGSQGKKPPAGRPRRPQANEELDHRSRRDLDPGDGDL